MSTPPPPAPERPAEPSPPAGQPGPSSCRQPGPWPPPGDRIGPEHLQAARDAGTAAGQVAAAWWAAHTIGDFAPEDIVATRAQWILAQLEMADPRILDALPTDAPGVGEPETPPSWYEAGSVPAWAGLPASHRDALVRAYHGAYTDAVFDGVWSRCRIAASPTGDARDLTHLAPICVRVGTVGVFTGGWLRDLRPHPAGTDRYTVGYLGVLRGSSAQGAVFAITRPVATRIIDDQLRTRHDTRTALIELGVAADRLEHVLNAVFPPARWESQTLIIDNRAATGAPARLDRIEPDTSGRYTAPVPVTGGAWKVVDPYLCERLTGPIPTPDGRPARIPLRHTPQVATPGAALRGWPRPPLYRWDGPEHRAELRHDGNLVALLALQAPTGPITAVDWLDDPFGPEDLAEYTARCARDGDPITVAELLTHLVTDGHLEQEVARARGRGATLARQVTPDGLVLATHDVWPAPRTAAAAIRLGRQVASRHTPVRGAGWEIWTGTGWLPIGATTAPHHRTEDSSPSNDPDLPSWLTAPPPDPDDLYDEEPDELDPDAGPDPDDQYPGWLDPGEPDRGELGLDGLDRRALITVGAVHGVLLYPLMTNPQMRAALRAHLPAPQTPDLQGDPR